MRNNVARIFLVVALIPVGLYGLMWGLWALRSSHPYSAYSQWSSGGMYNGYSPRVSPSGTSIVYSSPLTGQGDIYTMPITGGTPTRLTTGDFEDVDPCFTPDGKSIVFVRDNHLWIMAATGNGQHQITFDGWSQENPVVSPDGAKVMYVETFHNRRCALYVKSLGSSSPGVRFPTKRMSFDPAYDPKGDAYYGYLDGNGSRWIATTPKGGSEHTVAVGYEAVISPNGALMACLDEPYSQSLCLMQPSGKNRRILMNDRTYKSALSFLPDNRHLIYLESGSSQSTANIVEIDIRTLAKKTIASI